MAISADGTVLYTDSENTSIGTGLVFTDIVYSGNMCTVTASNNTGAVNRFSYYVDGAYIQEETPADQPVSTTASSAGGEYIQAYYQLLLDTGSDISALRNVVTDEFRWMTNILIADVVGDDAPEILYFTVEDEYGSYTPPSGYTVNYTHAAHSHLASFDPSTGRIFDLLDPGYTLYFDDYGNADGNFRIARAQYYAGGNDTIYCRGSGNISGASQYCKEYSYLYQGSAMEETYSVINITWDNWPQIDNPAAAQLINGTAYMNLIINSYGETDYRFLSYEEALEYFY